jgi:hypothetical protein
LSGRVDHLMVGESWDGRSSIAGSRAWEGLGPAMVGERMRRVHARTEQQKKHVCTAWEARQEWFKTWVEKSDVNDVYWFHFPYLITVLAYLCSQLATLVQIRYFMFDWTIYRIFGLNKAWKRDSLQMMIFVYICSTCRVFRLKTRFETWKAWNEINGVHTI